MSATVKVVSTTPVQFGHWVTLDCGHTGLVPRKEVKAGDRALCFECDRR